MKIDVVLGIIAGLMHILAFTIYNKQMLKGTSHPNSATWTLWAFLSILNCVTYILMSHDWVKGLLPIASTAACIATFVFPIFKGKLSRLNTPDIAALVIGSLSVFVWWYFRSATYANMILQVCVFISFIPTYRGVWKEPALEKALPWFIWSSAYIFSIVVVFIRWQGQLTDLVYPINCLLLHAGIGLLTFKAPK